MWEEIDGAIEKIRDTRAGWVTRRDAVELLGKVATKALDALQDASDEMDVDVKRSVDDMLGRASAALKGVKPKFESTPPTFDELAKSCAKEGVRQVEPDDEGYVVRVKLKDGRTQAVHIRRFSRADGVALIQVYTICGKADETSYAWALRANMKLIQGAVALAKQGDDERFVLTMCFLASEVTKSEIKAAVKEAAYYGDWIEQKVSGQDDF
ncbi:MAG: hypothetical protein HUU46_14410 [Candidatus Hydrogenedentes bacterium]|nr:hypothetical protein [Candidatus Hydrogenedentota bacterium]